MKMSRQLSVLYQRIFQPDLIACLLFACLVSCSTPTIYKSNSFQQYQDSHKTVAILPFGVSYDRLKLPKGMTEAAAKEAEKQEGFAMQNELYTRMLNRVQKGEYTVTFQDVAKTNSLISEAGVSYDALKTTDRKKICDLLKVDAVLSGTISREKPMSEGLAVGLGVVFGVWGATNKVNVVLDIHEHGSGEMIWEYSHEASGSVGSSTKSLAESLMKNISKRFPYRRPNPSGS